MSRTYRRKNYELTQGTSWDRKGRKTDGFNTTWDQPWIERYMFEGKTYAGWHWVRGEPIFRPMTKQERNEDFKRIHCDHRGTYGWGDANNRRSRRWYQKTQRQQGCNEIKKYMYDSDYEPMIEWKHNQDWWWSV